MADTTGTLLPLTSKAPGATAVAATPRAEPVGEDRPPLPPDVEVDVDRRVGKYYRWRGNTYCEKISNYVIAGHAFEDIYKCVENARCALKRSEDTETPYQSVEDIVNTVRQSSSDKDGKFLWPSPRYGIGKAIAAALHHLPVGHMVSIKNAQNIPPKYYRPNGEFVWNLQEF